MMLSIIIQLLLVKLSFLIVFASFLAFLFAIALRAWKSDNYCCYNGWKSDNYCCYDGWKSKIYMGINTEQKPLANVVQDRYKEAKRLRVK